MQIKQGDTTHMAACLAIARKLPEYFNDTGMEMMRHDLREHELSMAVDRDQMIGFISVQVKNSQVAEISWIAVLPERQQEGVGTQLIQHTLEELKKRGIRLLEVKTLAPTVEYEPYERTRRFYERRGFVLLDIIDPYPGWEPGNPCAIYLLILSLDDAQAKNDLKDRKTNLDK
jgi:ribosomal protein S18 acetylase RimI-like enzyme